MQKRGNIGENAIFVCEKIFHPLWELGKGDLGNRNGTKTSKKIFPVTKHAFMGHRELCPINLPLKRKKYLKIY